MKRIILSALLFVAGATFAQESKLSVSGSVDTYYSTNLSTGAKGTNGILSDVPANGFGLGMANTVFTYETGKAGVVADLAFGPRANAANMYMTPQGVIGAINQLYAYYNVNEKTTVTLGQFNTFYGYEVISPVANFNYSVSYLFGAGPFSHTGLKIDYAASEDLSLMLAVTNPHGTYLGSNIEGNDDYQLGAQVGFKGQYFNFAYGSDGFGFKDVLYLDYTGGFDASESFYVGINAAYSNSDDADYSYKGIALYLENSFSDTFALGLRPELFSTTDNNVDASILALTLTGSTKLTDNLKVISELRYDNSDDVTFYGEKSVTGLTIAAVYSF
jgi:hypothetical protein